LWTAAPIDAPTDNGASNVWKVCKISGLFILALSKPFRPQLLILADVSCTRPAAVDQVDQVDLTRLKNLDSLHQLLDFDNQR